MLIAAACSFVFKPFSLLLVSCIALVFSRIQEKILLGMLTGNPVFGSKAENGLYFFGNRFSN